MAQEVSLQVRATLDSKYSSKLEDAQKAQICETRNFDMEKMVKQAIKEGKIKFTNIRVSQNGNLTSVTGRCVVDLATCDKPSAEEQVEESSEPTADLVKALGL